ncbi:MAG: TolB family protein, partial [Pirellulales bacterium]
MKTPQLAITPFLLLSFALFDLSSSGAEPPKVLYLGINRQLSRPKPPKPAVAYIKQETCHETIPASLEATFGSGADAARGAAYSRFQPAIIRLAADAQPVRLELRVEGLKRLYFATLGRQPESGSAHFLSPRLFDKRGHSIELKLDSSMLAGKVDPRAHRATELKFDGTTHHGFALLPGGEVGFKLDGKYERLEVLVDYRREAGLPPHAAIDDRPIVTRAAEYRRVRETLWDSVARDFRARQSQIEMEMERCDGIWSAYTASSEGASNAYYLLRARQRLELAGKTLEFVQRTASRPEMVAALRALEERIDRAAEDTASSVGRGLFAQAVELRRRIVFSHPLLDFDRLLLTERPTPALSAPGDNYYALNNGTGPGLVVLDQWKTDRPRKTVLLEGKLPPGCAMHPDLSFDGERVVFAYADHTLPRERRQFFLYEIEVDGSGLRQITGRDDDPLAGAGGRMTVLCEDYDPCYLPDGGFAFISTRNQGGVRCHNGGRYCPTYLLYRCDAAGSNIRQLSLGEANEWDPTVMPDGRILWSRWDYINRPVIPTLGLWTIRPDGTAARHYFGNYTPNPCRICQSRPIPGSHQIVATTAGHHTMHAGSLILIDRQIAQDGLDAITRLTPEATFPESEAHSPVSFSTPYPLSEDLFLAAFCADPYPGSMAQVPRRNGFGIYLIDT